MSKVQIKKLLAGATTAAIIVGTNLTAHASESGVSEIITTASAGVMTDAKVVIASGLGIGVLFFGAKLLWGKFKSMAR